MPSLVGSEMCIRDRLDCKRHPPVETSPHQVLKVLGLVSRQGLLLVVDLESPPIVCCKLLVVTPNLRLEANPACSLVPAPSTHDEGWSPLVGAACIPPVFSRLVSIADSLSSKSLVCEASCSFKSSNVLWSPISDQPPSSSNFSLTYSMAVMFRRRSSNNSPELCA